MSEKDDASGIDQSRLERIETLAALGQVGAGVIHEVRNAMTGILGFVQVARRQLAGKQEKLDELLQLIEQESKRCQQLLADYLGFTRQRASERVPVDLAEVVISVERLVQHQLRLHKVALEVEIAPDLPAVHGDAAALKQVLLNLVVNALHATRAAGGHVRILATRRDGAARIEVRDDGPGVPAPLAEKIFDPFFSTKPAGEGTGLGLSVSRGIVEQHGGTLRLEDDAPGATFAITLPALSA